MRHHVARRVDDLTAHWQRRRRLRQRGRVAEGGADDEAHALGRGSWQAGQGAQDGARGVVRVARAQGHEQVRGGVGDLEAGRRREAQLAAQGRVAVAEQECGLDAFVHRRGGMPIRVEDDVDRIGGTVAVVVDHQHGRGATQLRQIGAREAVAVDDHERGAVLLDELSRARQVRRLRVVREPFDLGPLGLEARPEAATRRREHETSAAAPDHPLLGEGEAPHDVAAAHPRPRVRAHEEAARAAARLDPRRHNRHIGSNVASTWVRINDRRSSTVSHSVLLPLS